MAASLVITAKPVKVFYKDEGGKSNFLTATVSLPDSYTGPALPLKMSLFFECGRRVEDQDQDILALLDYKYTPAVVAPHKPCIIRYRLEKVSRRKDNQRFKMFVEVDYRGMAPEAAGGPVRLTGAYTAPVSVLSKRKTGQRFVVRRNPSPQQRMEAFTETLRSICGQLGAKVEALHSAVADNTRMMREQGARLERLESMLTTPPLRLADRTPAGAFPVADVADVAQVTMNDAAPTGFETDNATVSFLSGLMDVGAFETALPAAAPSNNATGAFVPPPLRPSATKELIDGAVAASFAMSADSNVGGTKRPRTALTVCAPAGGSESGDDSPRSPAVRQPMPRVVLTTGAPRPRFVPKVRRWRSMEITFTGSRPVDFGRAAKRARA